MPNEIPIFNQRLSRSRNSDNDILLIGQAMQKRVEAGEQGDEQRATLLRAELLDFPVRLGVYLRSVRRSGVTLDHRTRPV